MTVAILTDTGIDLSADVMEQMNIHLVKGWVRLGVSLYRDLPTEEVLARMQAGEQFVTTTPDAHELKKAYSRLLDAHEHVLMINVSRKLDNFHALSSEVAREFPGLVTVLDSQAASIGQGLLVLRATELAQQGHSAPEIVAALEGARPQSRHILVLKSLQYMHMNSRIGGFQAGMGKTLGITPVLTVKNGLISPLAQPRGFQNALNQMLRIGLDYGQQHPGARLASAYTPGSEGELAALQESLLSTGQLQDMGTYPFGSPIAANTGPGCLSIGLQPAV